MTETVGTAAPAPARPFLVPGSTARLDADVLADRAAIHDLVAAYSLFFDSGDFDGLGDLFTEDATFTFTPRPEGFPPSVTTRERIVSAMAALYRHNTEGRGAHQRHLTTNTVVIRLDATTAEARSLLSVCFAFDDGRYEQGRSGSYVDLLEKDGERWRIAHRTLWLRELPRIPAPVAPGDER
ncbi:nuclear transport factor 2 family protein [Streptomyces sp. UNOC14_S4]|uniref:nuclear transport factor 2 family protein n=1 Tax=Streptomyces sp. UNOC14_S4 TaxID=2872340 RepID=UPI001E5DCD25|nr:nuclear transport factor 2 family protein [Streptomyces sp. UNOC14_S4]MCC3769027.1 nuclear transport factor 2 family protein [Streptomyces sp. UNOC14_S4]